MKKCKEFCKDVVDGLNEQGGTFVKIEQNFEIFREPSFGLTPVNIKRGRMFTVIVQLPVGLMEDYEYFCKKIKNYCNHQFDFMPK